MSMKTIRMYHIYIYKTYTYKYVRIGLYLIVYVYLLSFFYAYWLEYSDRPVNYPIFGWFVPPYAKRLQLNLVGGLNPSEKYESQVG